VTVTNFGTIAGDSAIFAGTTATVINSGALTGGTNGVLAGDTANVINSGTISGGEAVTAGNTINLNQLGNISAGDNGVVTAGTAHVKQLRHHLRRHQRHHQRHRDSQQFRLHHGDLDRPRHRDLRDRDQFRHPQRREMGRLLRRQRTVSNSGTMERHRRHHATGAAAVINSGSITGGRDAIRADTVNVNNTGTLSGTFNGAI